MVSQQLTNWLVAVCILYPISTMAVILRGVAVRIRGRGLKPPDYLVFISWLCQTGYLIDVSVEGLALGAYGTPTASLPLDRITHSLRAFWISEWFWAFGVCSFRLAVVLLYVDIFRADVIRWRILLGTASVIVAYLVACVFTICLLCRPIQYNWDVTLNGTCGNLTAIEYFSAVFNMLLDIWVVYLPLPAIWTLQLPPQKKWILTASFSLGLGTAAANLGRLIQTVRCHSTDVTLCALNSSIIVFAEFTSGILVVSVPMLGPLLTGRGGKRGDPKSSEGAGSGGAVRTIGSIPLRGYKKHNGSGLDDSLFSRNEPEMADPVEDSTAALAMGAASMGHQAEIGWQSRNSSSTGMPPATPDAMNQKNTIVRTLGYHVDRS